MFKKIAFSGLGIVLLTTPFFAFATVPQWNRALSFGARGQDVIELQNTLIAQGDLATGNNTGYFGRLTQAAVQKFQCRTNIVCSGSPSTSGYGTVGPRTRAKILEGFSGGTISTNFSASPTSGVAPLVVTFTASSLSSRNVSIEFGDGTSDSLMEGLVFCNGCNNGRGSYSGSIQHTYTRSGSYKAHLLQSISACDAPGCEPVQKEVGTATITVSNGSVGTPTITLLSPNGGETWQGVSGQTIRWNSSNVTNGTVNIELIDYGYNSQTEDNRTHYRIENYAANTGSYTINPDSSIVGQVKPGNNYKIRIGAYQQTSAGLLDYDNLVQGDLSEAPFTIY